MEFPFIHSSEAKTESILDEIKIEDRHIKIAVSYVCYSRIYNYPNYAKLFYF